MDTKKVLILKKIEKPPRPATLIDPKTNKPYMCPTDAWRAFADLLSVYCQKKENQKIEVYLEKKKVLEELTQKFKNYSADTKASSSQSK